MNAKYAIVQAFGQQFNVREGDKIKTNYVNCEAGTTLTFDKVLLINKNGELTLGKPTVQGAKITAKVDSHGRNDKVLVFKYLRKSKSRKIYGHRQPYSVLSITSIEG